MSSLEDPLLAKWKLNTGLSSSSLLSSSTLTKSSIDRDSSRKRKTPEVKVTDKKKKVKDEPGSMASSSLLHSSTGSSLLSSGSLLMHTSGSSSSMSMRSRSAKLDAPSGSLTSGSAALGLSKTSLGLTLGGSGSTLRSSLTSSLLSKPSTEASGISQKRNISQTSYTTSNSLSSAGSDLSKCLTMQPMSSGSLLSGGLSSLTSGSTLLSRGHASSLAGPSHLMGNIKIESVSITATPGIHGDLLRGISIGSSTDSKTKGKKKATSKKAEKKGGKGAKRARTDKYNASRPEYRLNNVIAKQVEITLPKFTTPTMDRSLMAGAKLHDVNGLKFALVNAVSGSLICQPNFRSSADETRVALVAMSQQVICYDPEFILKVALYTRKQLNIRTTANFLLALASHTPACRPYLKKYFNSSIALPSDWIEVAEVYSAFPEKTLALGSLPSALRRAMIAKFPDFDKYQLAKYNKESSQKKKKKKQRLAEEAAGRGRGRGRGGRGGGARGRGQVMPGGRGQGVAGRGRGGAMPPQKRKSESDSDSSDSDEEYEEWNKAKDTGVVFDDGESPEQLQKASFTLKQLIRKLHIVEPVEHVMCLIGKKYPSSMDEFYQSRLPGTFEEERSGKRMKLPVPETWETQVSMKGNKASTWQELLDHKKLPFMAMLRNLRNLIKAGVSNKHHTGVIRRLTDERQVINSKQFPFRFFSAFEVLDTLEKDYVKDQAAYEAAAIEKATDAAEGKSRGGRGRGRGQGRGGATGKEKEKLTAENWWIIKKQRKQKDPKEPTFDAALINRYKKALDTAVKIATVYNVAPIRGRTIILCDIGPNMDVPCTSARGLGKPRTMQEVSVLLGLMCKYSCEESSLVIFNKTTSRYLMVELDKGTILENMAIVLDKKDLLDDPKSVRCTFEQDLPMSILYEHLRDRIQIDNLLLLTGGGDTVGQRGLVNSFLEIYRRIVNPDTLYVNVSFAGKSCGFAKDIKPEHDNNIYISGFSDQILRFIAERGDGGQLRHIEKIDEAFNLKALSSLLVEKPKPKLSLDPVLQIASHTPSWRTARVFISSTFRDMHGERDLLTRFVFPELRALGKKRFINIYEVDLRWGVTEEETRHDKTLELCLTEIQKCQFFLGILGERYGWVPDKYHVPSAPEYDWLRDRKPDMSITEIEMQAGALQARGNVTNTRFFFIRDNAFEKDVPKGWKEDFVAESSSNASRMAALKEQIRYHSGLEVFDNYPCCWGGVVEGKPMVTGLDQFAIRALGNLWNGIKKMFPDEPSSFMMDEMSHFTKLHENFVQHHMEMFVGRIKLKKECMKQLADMKSGVLVLHGKPGSGKSALLASLIKEYVDSKQCDSGLAVITHFVGAAPGSTNILATLKRLGHELNSRFALQTQIPDDFKNIVSKLEEMLAESGTYCGSPLVVFLDGLDGMDPAYLPHNLDWLPEQMPKNVIFVLTCHTYGKTHQSLRRRKVAEVTVETLDMWDKSEMVRSHLAVHRKSLDETPFNNQMKLLVSKKEANVPLYLSLACEELRVYGLFEKMTLKLKSLPHTVPLLLQEVISRMESDIDLDLVSTALCLLVCCKEGLSMEELHDLLTLKSLLGNDRPNVQSILNVAPSPEDSLPYAKFAQLQRALHSLINPTNHWSGTLSLAHVDIQTAIRNRYLKGSAAMETEAFLHRLLAGYFYSQADVKRDGSWQGNSARAFQELPYHLAKSFSYTELGAVVCSLQFIYNKCKLGLAPRLLDDYQPLDITNKAQEREQAKFFDKEQIKHYKSFVSRNLHILSSHPALTWQQAYNENSESQPAMDVQDLIQSTSLPANERALVEWSSKPANVDPCYMTISNLPQAMTCVAISPDNQHFVCGGFDSLVHLYDLKTGKEVRSFRGHADTITDVCFVGKNRVCSVSMDASVSVWDAIDGHRVFTLKNHNRRVNSCTSDKSGNTLATAAWDCLIKIWSMSKGNLECEFKVGSPVNCVGFHPEGQKLVSGQWDTTIKIWDVFRKTKLAVLRGHKTSVRDVAYSPTGRHIASAALDGDVKLWAADTGAQIGNIEGHALPINKLTFSPTGKELVTVSDDHKVKVWSGHLGKPISTIGDEELGPAMSVAISPLRDYVAIGYHSGIISIHDVYSGMKLISRAVHTASVKCLKYLQYDYLLSGSDDSTAKILTGLTLRDAHVFKHHDKGIMGLDVCRHYLAFASEDCTCSVIENPFKYTYHGKQKPTFSNMNVMCTLALHTGPVTSCSFNLAGNRIATASRDMSVRIWDIIGATFDGTQSLHVIHSCHNDWVTEVKWSNMADILLTAANDFNLKVWDVSKIGDMPGETVPGSGVQNACKEKFQMTGHMGAINHAGYSYGCVVSTCADGSVKVWSHKGVEITTLYGHTQRANGCDISVKLFEDEVADEVGLDFAEVDKEEKKMLQPKLDNVLVATCGDDGTTRLWYPLQANELACLTGHADKVLSVASDQQGNLCTSSLDKNIKLWSCDEQSQHVIGGHDAAVTFVLANPWTPGMVLSGSRDQTVKLWMLDPVTGRNMYTCVSTLQAHEKAVTCGCWLNEKTFVTGSDDTTICVWNVIHASSKKIRVQKERVLRTTSPVLSMDRCGDMGKPHFITSEWSGAIKVWSIDQELSELKTLYTKSSWLLKVRWAGNNTVLVSTMEGCVLELSVLIPTDASKRYNIQPSLKHIHTVPSSLEPDNVPAHKQQPSWILDIAGGSKNFVTGNTKGEISIMINGTIEFEKVHGDQISCVLLSKNGVLFTGSRDKTIKIWDTDTEEQIGQFFCASPVTCMCFLDDGTSSDIPVAYADELGYINFIIWKSGK